MRNTWVSRVGMVTLVGVMVLSAGLVLMPDKVLADKGDRDDKGGGSATDLSGITQNWDKNLPSGSRFTVLSAFGGAAVRDNNTGLVWERAPDINNRPWSGASSTSASSYCANKIVGGAAGWRLPSVVELKSVQDPSLPAPFVPASVFTGVQSAPYWSATAVAWDPTLAWHVYFHSSLVDEEPVTSTNLAWCVRGPMNADAY